MAHDCSVGDNTILANNAQLAGHVDAGRLGNPRRLHRSAPVRARRRARRWPRADAILLRDHPPYVISQGQSALEPLGINFEGLNRRGFAPTRRHRASLAYKTLYREGLNRWSGDRAHRSKLAEENARRPRQRSTC